MGSLQSLNNSRVDLQLEVVRCWFESEARANKKDSEFVTWFYSIISAPQHQTPPLELTFSPKEPSATASNLDEEVCRAVRTIHFEDLVRHALYRDSGPVTALMDGLQGLREAYIRYFLRESYGQIPKVSFDSYFILILTMPVDPKVQKPTGILRGFEFRLHH